MLRYVISSIRKNGNILAGRCQNEDILTYLAWLDVSRYIVNGKSGGTLASQTTYIGTSWVDVLRYVISNIRNTDNSGRTLLLYFRGILHEGS